MRIALLACSFLALTLLPAEALAARSSKKLPSPEISTPAKAVEGENLGKPLSEVPCAEHPMNVIDDALFAWYEKTPKLDGWDEDKQAERDFSAKDPEAAAHAGMTLKQFVIGGMEPPFKRKLYCMLLAMEKADLGPGLTSGFRDQYRQHLASSGRRTCDTCTFHGSRPELGYGHGVAADIVAVRPTRDERLKAEEFEVWPWIDAHGAEYGIARIYRCSDPVHVGPIGGREYAGHYQSSCSKEAKGSKKKKISVHVKKKHKKAHG